MFRSKKTKSSHKNDYATQTHPEEELNLSLSTSLEENQKMIDNLFIDVDIMISRRFQNTRNDALDFCIYFTDGLVNSVIINENIIEPLLLSDKLTPGPDLFQAVKDEFLLINDIKETTDIKQIIQSVTYGDTLLFINGCEKALILSSKTFTLRATSEPEGERVIYGPREGFNEGVLVNLSMVRRRLRTQHLKMKFQQIGRQTATTVCVCYMDNIVNKKILKEVMRRLELIDVDAILDSNYIVEQIAEKSPVGFPTCGVTERPDIVAAKLLEGRIAIFVDGTPVVLTAPYLFIETFISNEDYYLNTIYSSFARALRLLSFLITTSIPALYIAIISFQYEIIPEAFLINIALERSLVPLPAATEAFVMLIVFDILRETGVRMPSHMGQSMSIVGALVIGQAAVEAKLVASPMIIVVAITGITSMVIPKLYSGILACRYTFLFMASCFGLYGLVTCWFLLLTHLLSLHSFGVPIILIPKNLKFQQVKDSFIRAPWRQMMTRYAPFTSNIQRSAVPEKENRSEDAS